MTGSARSLWGFPAALLAVGLRRAALAGLAPGLFLHSPKWPKFPFLHLLSVRRHVGAVRRGSALLGGSGCAVPSARSLPPPLPCPPASSRLMTTAAAVTSPGVLPFSALRLIFLSLAGCCLYFVLNTSSPLTPMRFYPVVNFSFPVSALPCLEKQS